MTTPSFRFTPTDLPPGASALRQEVRAFIEDEKVAGRLPRSSHGWARNDRGFSERLGARGWIGMTWPKCYGGHERHALERYVVTEELLAGGAPIRWHWTADRQTGPLILEFGTEDQRRRFLPAIALLEQACRVVEMVSPHDWRLRALTQGAVYLHPPGAEAEHMLERIFARHAEGEIQHGGELIVNDRAIPCQRRAGNILWFEFAALCEGPRGVADYIALARQYATVILANVPQFSIYTEDAAHRLILLVDKFYDRKVKLVISAAGAITDLYDGARLRAEFGRTESRLIEMQSEDYLASAWLPER